MNLVLTNHNNEFQVLTQDVKITKQRYQLFERVSLPIMLVDNSKYPIIVAHKKKTVINGQIQDNYNH